MGIADCEEIVTKYNSKNATNFVNAVFSATYAPNSKAGMVTVSMDEESLPNNSMVIGSVLRSCKNIPSVSKKDFYIDITVQTQYGGIITVGKMLNGR